MSFRLWEVASKSGPPSMSGRGRRGPGHARARHVRIQLCGARAAAVVVLGLGLGIAVAPLTATAMSTAPAQHSASRPRSITAVSSCAATTPSAARQINQSVSIMEDIPRQSAAQAGIASYASSDVAAERYARFPGSTGVVSELARSARGPGRTIPARQRQGEPWPHVGALPPRMPATHRTTPSNPRTTPA
jgi:hypothetical protein